MYIVCTSSIDQEKDKTKTNICRFRIVFLYIPPRYRFFSIALGLVYIYTYIMYYIFHSSCSLHTYILIYIYICTRVRLCDEHISGGKTKEKNKTSKNV